MTYQTARLSEVASIRHGGTPSTKEPRFWNGDIPWVSPKDMGAPVLTDTADHITPQGVAGSATSLMPANCIFVVARSGVLAHSVPIALAQRPMAFNQDLKAIVVDPAQLDAEFAFWFLRSQERRILLQGVKRGATVHSLHSGFVEKLPIPLPPFPEQRRIVDILNRANGIRRLRREALDKSRQLIPALFADMFGDPATNPRGWPQAPLRSVAEFVAGSSLPSGVQFEGQAEGSLLLKVSDLNHLRNQTFVDVAKLWTPGNVRGQLFCRPEAVVFPKRGAAIATNKKRLLLRDAALDPNLMGVRPDSSHLDAVYLLGWFNCFDLVSIQSGSTVPQLNKRDLAPLMIPIPPRGLQSEFRESFLNMYGIAGQQERMAEASRQLVASLMAQLFDGSVAGRQAA